MPPKPTPKAGRAAQDIPGQAVILSKIVLVTFWEAERAIGLETHKPFPQPNSLQFSSEIVAEESLLSYPFLVRTELCGARRPMRWNPHSFAQNASEWGTRPVTRAQSQG